MLVKETLKTELKQLQQQMRKQTNQAVADDKYAELMATAIDNFIKTAMVTVAFPIPVSVDPVTHLGGTTAVGTGTIT